MAVCVMIVSFMLDLCARTMKPCLIAYLHDYIMHKAHTHLRIMDLFLLKCSESHNSHMLARALWLEFTIYSTFMPCDHCIFS